MSRHRQVAVRPRYGRVAAVSAAVTVTLTAVLGGMGVIPTVGTDAVAVATSITPPTQAPVTDASAIDEPGRSPAVESAASVVKKVADPVVLAFDPTLAPPDSGDGRRVVFSQTGQRVWLIADDDTVERTYLVSGSVYDNLDPGTYAVFSRSEQAWGIDDSGSMAWFVRFAHGPNAAIGFHDIPIDDGAPIQSERQLGTALSHGCIRQRTDDALALWDFAPVGTEVVVI